MSALWFWRFLRLHQLHWRALFACTISLTHCACAAAAVVVQARKNAGIGARAKVEILAAEQDMYVSRTTGK